MLEIREVEEEASEVEDSEQLVPFHLTNGEFKPRGWTPVCQAS